MPHGTSAIGVVPAAAAMALPAGAVMHWTMIRSLRFADHGPGRCLIA
jgi:hypothetical protein